MKKYFFKFSGIICLLIISQTAALSAFADGIYVPVSTKTEVVTIQSKDSERRSETVEAKILEGDEKGKIVIIENIPGDLTPGQKFFSETIVGSDGKIDHYFTGYDRLPIDYFFIGLFILCAILIGGKQGARGIISLAGSLLLVAYILLPGIASGHSPLALSVIVAALIIILGSYVTHGFNRTTTAAILGMFITLIITSGLSYYSITFAHLSGVQNDLTDMGIDAYDFKSLLFAGMLIGLLGILIDIAITQAVAVEELLSMNPECSKKVIYARALRMGREHIGTLVNMLVILYVGTSLPLFLLYYKDLSLSIKRVMNLEIFSTAITHTMIGSIGLMLSVPITTLISLVFLTNSVRNKK